VSYQIRGGRMKDKPFKSYLEASNFYAARKRNNVKAVFFKVSPNPWHLRALEWIQKFLKGLKK
jgi:hypothetical protein